MPVIGLLDSTSPDVHSNLLRWFRQGLNETGHVEGRNVAIEYRWSDGQYDRVPELAAEPVRRQVAMIATPGSIVAALAAKAATGTIPIVFSVAKTRSGLVLSPASPGRAAMRPASIFSLSRCRPSGCGSCMTWCPRPFALPCSSIRPMHRAPSPHCGTCRKPPPPSGCKPKSSTPRRSARSTRPLPPSRASAPCPLRRRRRILRQPRRAICYADGAPWGSLAYSQRG